MTTYNILINILYAFELLSFALAVKLYLDGARGKVFISFLIILLLTSAVETFGFLQKVLIEDKTGLNNLFWFNIYNYITSSLWYYIFYVMLLRWRKLIVVLFFMNITIIAYEAFFLVDISKFPEVYPFVFTGLSLLVLVLLYFTKLIETKDSESLKQNLFFWICIGLLFYHVINIPFTLMQNTLLDAYYDYGMYFYIARVVFAIIMYLCFSVGLFIFIKRDSLAMNNH